MSESFVRAGMSGRLRSLFALQFVRFAMVGAGGALVDMAALWCALNLLGANAYGGRVISYLVAATFTWACNRRLTFQQARSGSILWQWLRYLAVGAVGGLVNFAVYSAVVGALPTLVSLPPALLPLLPYLGVLCGSVAGLAFNFLGARRLVFR